MKRKEKLSVLIIGCGNIAGGSHLSNKFSSISHANAYKKNINFKLTACLDSVKKKSLEFKKKWSIEKSYCSIAKLKEDYDKFDVISICVPTKYHLKYLKLALQFKPSIVLCEKPLTLNLDESTQIVKKYKQINTPLAVNYIRRWSNDILKLKEEINKGIYGKIISISGQYNKGIFNNGSHMVDLFIYLFGKLHVKWAGEHIYDFWKNDPSISFILETNLSFYIMVNALNASYYPLFEIQIYTEKKIIEMKNSGNEWIFRNTDNNKNKQITKKTRGTINQSMHNSMNNIIKYLRNDSHLYCTGEDALLSQKICHQIFDF